jgi:hypothetical protein
VSLPSRKGSDKGTDKPQVPREPDSRIAPDPFTAVLPALAALGAIASIAAINWTAEERTPDRSKATRKAATAIRELETCCLGLSEIFRRFQRNPKLFAGEGSQGSSPLKFGVHGVRVGPDGSRLFHQLMNDIASMLVLASQNAPETLYFAFGECQERLNKLIQTRATLKVAVDSGAEIAERLTHLVRELKKYRPD